MQSELCYILPTKTFLDFTANFNTCKCVLHANMEHLLLKLRELKVINYLTAEILVKQLICDEPNIICYLRTCEVCKYKTVSYNIFDFLVVFSANQLSNAHIFMWEKGSQELLPAEVNFSGQYYDPIRTNNDDTDFVFNYVIPSLLVSFPHK